MVNAFLPDAQAPNPAVPFESPPHVPCSARRQILLVPPSVRTQNQTTSPKSLPSLLPIIWNIAPTGLPTGLPAFSPAQNLSSTPQPHRMEHTSPRRNPPSDLPAQLRRKLKSLRMRLSPPGSHALCLSSSFVLAQPQWPAWSLSTSSTPVLLPGALFLPWVTFSPPSSLDSNAICFTPLSSPDFKSRPLPPANLIPASLLFLPSNYHHLTCHGFYLGVCLLCLLPHEGRDLYLF